MRRSLAITILFALAVSMAPGQGRGPGRTSPASLQYPPLGKTETEKRILQVLADIEKAGDLFANVPAADGRMLRVLTEAVNARNVVEIGTSTGISGLWFCLALTKTGGRLQTFEINPGRIATARGHFKKAGVDGMVTVVEGDAHENVTKLKGPIDVVFIDADKDGYVDYFQKVAPLVRPGGLILAHNLDSAPDYVKAVSTSPDFETVVYMDGGQLGVTLKKR